MKRIITTLSIFIFFLFTVKAQTAHPFELGFNGGAAWLKSDVKTQKVGSGLGLTFGQTYCMNKTSPILWGWRFRYLNANTYGQDTKKSFGIANNEVLNGSDTTLDYYNKDGYVYHNYKTHIDELAVELVLGANKIRERTNLYPYIFAGAGLTKAVARINQLDDNSKLYEYADNVDTTGTSSSSEILSQINTISDGTYESLADGNLKPTWKFMPSLGVGLGFEIIKGFSLGLEHKMTWAFNDVLDGQRWSDNNKPTGSNDMYHYTSFWIKFSFGRGHKSTPATTTTTTPTNTPTLTNTNPAPVINFTNPNSSPFNTSSPNMNVTGTITNINSISDMSMTMNGNQVNGFTYNSSTHLFSYPANLQSGSNTFVVTAVNTAGTVSSTATVVYSVPVAPTGIAPVVNITSPSQNPFTSGQAFVNVTGSVQNISGREQIQILLNGAVLNDFTYNNSSRNFSANVNLIQGANTFAVTATNNSGNDSKNITLILKSQPVAISPPPVITITNPSSNPFNTNSASVPVNANVLNITSPSQIAVLVNGGPVMTSAFNYNLSTRQLSFNANLVEGANTVVVSATNVGGSDSKTQTIIYTKPVQASPPPVITITNPSSNPFNTNSASVPVNATVLNITSPSQISVLVNGGPVMTSAFNYNLSTRQLSFNANLVQGANTVVVSATNVGGSDSKTQTIIYTKPVQATPPPVITITNPSANPFNTTTASAAVNATVLNITSPSQIAVLVNGGPIMTSAFNYNLNSHQLSFNANLIEGANTIVVSATNVGGSDSKTQTIIYTKPVQVSPPPVITITNPSANPFNTTTASAAVNATVLNITSPSQIAVLVNGGPVMTSAFNYNLNSHQLSFNANLVEGANTIVVSATNVGGSDSKTQTIIYIKPVQATPAPVITITNPVSNPFGVSTATTALNANVLNVNNSSQISVSINGNPTSAFSFSPATHQLSVSANLIVGSNSIVISATNAGGSDSKTQIVNYTLPLAPPVITFTNPASASTTVSANTFPVAASVTNIKNSGMLSVKLNGTPVTGFVYMAAAKKVTFNANLIPGNNTITITATNGSGTDSKTVTIIYNQVIAPNPIGPDTVATPGNTGSGNKPATTLGTDEIVNKGIPNDANVSPDAPQIVFVTPGSATATTSDAIYNITVKVVNVTNPGAITVKINGVLFTGTSFNNRTKMLIIPAPLNMGLNTITIDAANLGLTKKETLNITRQ